MNLCTSVFAYLCSIGLYKRIVNADTRSLCIANADGHRNIHMPSKLYTPKGCYYIAQSVRAAYMWQKMRAL